MNSDKEKPVRIKVQEKAGCIIVKYKPKFSNDSKFLFCCAENVIKVFSTASGECLHILKGHETPVVSVYINPLNSMQLLSCSEDGVVIYWSYLDGQFLKSCHLNSNVRGFYVLKGDNSWFVLVPQIGSKGTPNKLFKVSFLKNNEITLKLVMKADISHGESMVSFGRNGNYVVALKKSRIYVQNLKTKEYASHFGDKWTFTCVATHPNSECFATGNSSGKIFLWYNIFSKEPIKTFLHWHSVRLEDLAFTAEGSKLWSGGGECVLVDWTITRSYTRNYLPRLGAPIAHITTCPNNSFVAASLYDNSILLINSDRNICQIFQSFTRRFDNSHTISTGLIYDPHSKSVVCNGKLGHLQFYSFDEDKFLFNLNIVNENYYHKEKDFTPINTDVVKLAISQDGLALVTFEMRNDHITHPEFRLKFWTLNETSQRFDLNTCIYEAHNKEVNSLLFYPLSKDKSLMAVSAGEDECFKLWSQVSNNQDGKNWMCESVGTYRNLPSRSVDISEDGSMLAVSFGSSVTLWDAYSLDFNTALSFPHDTMIRQVLFGRQSRSYFLITASSEKLIVWNLLSLTVQVNLTIDSCLLTRDSLSEYVAAFVAGPTLLVFRPGDVGPTYVYEYISFSRILCAVFIPQSVECDYVDSSPLVWQKKSQLYFMTEEQKVLTVEDVEVEDKRQLIQISQNLPKTPFEALLADKRTSNVTPVQLTHHDHQIQQQTILDEIFQSTTQTLPAVSDLCHSFLTILNTKDQISESPETRKASNPAASEPPNLGVDKKSFELNVSNDMEIDIPDTENLPEQIEDVLKDFKTNCEWMTKILAS